MIARIFSILLLPFAYIFATELPAGEVSKMTGSIMQIAINQADSIAGLDDDRLYLKSENIFYSQFGYVLHNAGSVIVLPRLSFDEHGQGFLLRRSPDDFQLTCSNPNCGKVWWFSDTWSIHCPRCGSVGN